MAKKRTTPDTVRGQLREAIIASAETHYAIAKRAGIRPEQLDRFVSGERPNLNLDTVSAICTALGWELRPKGKR